MSTYISLHQTIRIMLAWVLFGLIAVAASADNTLSTARDIGVLVCPVTLSDSIGQSDNYDFVRFQLTEARRVFLALNAPGVDASLSLYTPGPPSASWHSTNAGTGTENIAQDLGPGTYFASAYAFAGNSSYTLRLNTRLPNPRTERRDLGVVDGMGGLNGSKIANGTVAADLSYIDYTFSVPGTRRIRVQLRSPLGGALFDSGNRPIGVLQNGLLETTLNAGSYAVRLLGTGDGCPSSSVIFSLLVQASTIGPPDTAANTPAQARHLGRPGNPPLSVNEHVGQDDFDDYFQVTVAPASTLNIYLRQQGENANLWLYDLGGNELARSWNLGRADESISFNTIRGGEFRIRVGIATRNGSILENSDYAMLVGTLPMSVPPPIPPPPSPAAGPGDSPNAPQTARILGGVNEQGLTWTETVGASGDPADWFYIYIGSNSGLITQRVMTVQMTGLTAPITVQILNDKNQVVATVGSGFNSSFSFDTQLGLGNYFLGVIAAGGPTSYTMQPFLVR